jgi:ribosomal protein S18 acetylase RimI-like enzyme
MTPRPPHAISYKIRDVSRSDIPVVATLVPHEDETFSQEWLLSQQAAGCLDYIAAWIENVPVAQGLILWAGYPPGKLADEFPCTPVIRSVEVAEKYRSCGIGSAIVGELEARARSRGYTYTSLGVMPENTRAESLWRRLGYTDWGKGPYAAVSVYQRAETPDIVRQERFLPMRKHLHS